ncbi:MAG: OmpA family protein [Succinivibrio sp.]|nr:OmpA family protein [Succinivibrio sp.]
MKKKPPEHENLERWMVSYADFMTLLFALFVVLYAFAMAKQSDAKAMAEAIAQSFNEQVQISSPGGVLLVPGAISSKMTQEVEEAIKQSQSGGSGDEGKQIIENGGVIMNFQVTTTSSTQQREDTTSGSDDDKEGQNSADSSTSSGDLVISENEISKNDSPRSDNPNGGSKSGEGGFQVGGSSDKFEKGGTSEVDATTQGEGKVGTHFDAVRRSISEAISQAGMEKYIDIEEDSHWLSININSGLLFAEGSASVLAASRPVIGKIAVTISNINNYIRIRGYTDDSFIPNGIFRNSWDLSANRAVSVLEELEKAGINPERMAIEAFGQFSPKYSNKTSAGRSLNRKVVIAISRYAMERKPVLENAEEILSGQSDNRNYSGKAGTNDIGISRGEDNRIELNFSGKKK